MGTHTPSLDTTRISRALDRGREKIKRTLSSRPHGESRTEPYRALSAPLVTLFVSAAAKEQSEEAFAILAESGTAFQVDVSENDNVFARFAEKDQNGLDGIRNLADALQSASSILLEPGEGMNDELDRRRDPGLEKRAARERDAYLKTAHGELERILGATASAIPQRVS